MIAKLPSTKPTLTPAEQAACDAYSNALWSAKHAKKFKNTVIEIALRLGRIATERGFIATADATSYPMPSLEEWDARLYLQVLAVDKLSAHGDSPIAASRIAELEAAQAVLQQMREITPSVVSYHETAAWMKEATDYFKAAGVIVPQKAVTVKFYETAAAPVRPKLPKAPKAKKGDHP